jgi:hypothetical protein
MVGTLSVYLCLQIPSLKIKVDAESLLPQTHPFVIATNQIESLFGGRNQMVIGVIPRQGTVLDEPTLSVISRITEGILTMPGVIPSQVLSLTSAKAKAIVGTRDGMEIRPLVRSGNALNYKHFKELLIANPVYLDTAVARDGSVGIILADFRLGADLPSYQVLLQNLKRVIASAQTPGVEIVLGGLAVNLAWLEIYSSTMLWLCFLALGVVMSVLYLSFRSLQGMVIPTFTALLSAGWGLGLMGLAGVSLDVANVTTPILIMAIAAGHSVQMLKRYYEEYAKRQDSSQAVIESLTKVAPAMMTAGLIAAISFLSLLTFETQTIRTFGLFTAYGILSALVLEMTFIPALRACLPSPKERELRREQKADIFDQGFRYLIQRIRTRRSRQFFIPVAGLVLVLILGTWFIRVDNSMKGNFRVNSEVRIADRTLNQRMAGTNSLSLLIEGPDADSIKDPVLLQAMEATQRYIEQYDQVGKTISLVDYLIRLNQALHDEVPWAAHLPPTRALVSQYLLLYSAGGDPRDFDSLVDDQYRMALITAFLKTDSSAYIENLITGLRAFTKERFPARYRVSIGGGITQGVALNEIMVHGKILNIVQVGAIIGLLTAIIFRSALAGLLTLIPLVLAVLANFGLMGLAGIRLDIGTSVVAAMAVGIGADYAIYLLYRLREEYRNEGDLDAAIERTLHTAGKAVIYVALSVGLGYAVLIASPLQFHVRMGILVAVTMLVSCAASVILLPALVARVRPVFVVGRPSAAVVSKLSIQQES